ncbi:hypothetical protein FSP39_014715 [Pinctada imbricata]|uniref:Reticulon domain-containing protein n=1 Tax=Pinctada imbricata TaxID=66713 RepID=A0AA88XEL4_PINIB|nr:hypothetical protein FSP39_014715 [Pinctada imbricata]
MLFILLSLACFSVLSVLAYLSLALLTITLSFRVYKNVLQAVQKTGDAHPFRYVIYPAVSGLFLCPQFAGIPSLALIYT